MKLVVGVTAEAALAAEVASAGASSEAPAARTAGAMKGTATEVAQWVEVE